MSCTYCPSATASGSGLCVCVRVCVHDCLPTCTHSYLAVRMHACMHRTHSHIYSFCSDKSNQVINKYPCTQKGDTRSVPGVLGTTTQACLGLYLSPAWHHGYQRVVRVSPPRSSCSCAIVPIYVVCLHAHIHTYVPPHHTCVCVNTHNQHRHCRHLHCVCTLSAAVQTLV